MNFDEQVDLVTLTWMGRGDGSIADWDELRDLAAPLHDGVAEMARLVGRRQRWSRAAWRRWRRLRLVAAVSGGERRREISGCS